MTGGTCPPGCGAREAASLTYQPSLQQHTAGRKSGRVSPGALCAQSAKSGVFHREPFFRCYPCQEGTKGHLGRGEQKEGENEGRRGRCSGARAGRGDAAKEGREKDAGGRKGRGDGGGPLEAELLLRLCPRLSPPSSKEDGSPLTSPRSATRAPCPSLRESLHKGVAKTLGSQESGATLDLGFQPPTSSHLPLPWPARLPPPPTTQGPHL